MIVSKYNEAQKKATMKYMKENLDEIKFRVPKGRKEVYKQHADEKGMSLTSLIVKLLDESIEAG